MQLFLFSFMLIVYFVIHSLLAATKVKTFLIQNGLSKKYYRLIYNFLAIVLLLPIYFVFQNLEAIFLFKNLPLQYIGLGMAALGSVLLIVALKQYNLAEFAGTQQLRNKSTTTTARLKTTGFNAIVRHPLYFAGLIIIWSLFLFRPTDLVLVIGLVSTAYLFFGTKLEERKLVAEFGEAYLEYQKKVGMLLPFL